MEEEPVVIALGRIDRNGASRKQKNERRGDPGAAAIHAHSSMPRGT
jgi:hypothetical protein